MKLSGHNIESLTDRFENGKKLDFLFFWGHTSNNYGVIGPNCFSQWFVSEFTVAGITFKSAEHWMMAQKALLFEDLEGYEQIVLCDHPAEAKSLGRKIRNYDEEVWDSKRFEIVINGNIHKFNQHPPLLNFLMATGDKILVEASPVDLVWGIGLAADNTSVSDIYSWRRKNLLDFALMEVQAFFKRFGSFEYPPANILPPWRIYPGIDSRDMFWRMGKGEDLLMEFATFYLALKEKEREVNKLCYPPTGDWEDFYDP